MLYALDKYGAIVQAVEGDLNGGRVHDGQSVDYAGVVGAADDPLVTSIRLSVFKQFNDRLSRLEHIIGQLQQAVAERLAHTLE